MFPASVNDHYMSASFHISLEEDEFQISTCSQTSFDATKSMGFCDILFKTNLPETEIHEAHRDTFPLQQTNVKSNSSHSHIHHSAQWRSNKPNRVKELERKIHFWAERALAFFKASGNFMYAVFFLIEKGGGEVITSHNLGICNCSARIKVLGCLIAEVSSNATTWWQCQNRKTTSWEMFTDYCRLN